MANQLHNTSLDPEPIIADLRLRLAERTAERDETVLLSGMKQWSSKRWPRFG